MATTTASLAAALIRSLEGLELTSYQDTGGVWTVGFGTTSGIKAGMTITYDQAVAWLERDMAPLFLLVKNLSVTAGAGYVSFGYNAGIGALQRVLSGQSQLSDFIHDRHGNVLSDLVSRRLLESQLISV